MPSKTVHIAIGALAGVGTYYLICKTRNQPIELKWLIGSATLGAVVGMLPDVIERPLNPHHRQLFHSIGFALAITLSGKKIQESEIDSGIKNVTSILIGSYVSHIAIDAFTPMSIPLLGLK